MPEEWELSDDENDSLLVEWEALDRAAAEYLAERIPGVLNADGAAEDGRWVDRLAETISPSAEPAEQEIESVAAVMALQHADWLGLVLGVVRRGRGGVLDPELVQSDIDGLEDVDGEIEDREGHLAVLDLALLHLTPLWHNLGVLDDAGQLTERGVSGLPIALHRIWSQSR